MRIRASLALLAAAGMIGASAVGAGAVPGDGGYPGGPTPPPRESPPVRDESPGRQAGTNEPATAQVRTCSLYAGGGSYGMTCRGATGDSLTYAQILGSEPVPRCWHEPVPEDFTPPESEDELEPGGKWYLLTCLESGIDRDTKQATGPLRFSQEPEYVMPGELEVLGPGGWAIVSGERNTRQIPEPFAATSPSEKPRVGQDVAFYVPPSNTVGQTITVSGPGIGTVQMRARQTELVVWPLGSRPAPVVDCAGGGIDVAASDTRESRPGACWWNFERSSASQPSDTYPMQVEAGWVVEYNGGGDWQVLGRFTRQQQIEQEVREVQTIVVP